MLAAYIFLLPVAVGVFPPERTLLGFLASVFGLSAVLVDLLVDGRASEVALGQGLSRISHDPAARFPRSNPARPRSYR